VADPTSDAPDPATDPLPGLPGADRDPGSGPAEPACFDGVLADLAGPAGHVQHRLEAHADVVGPLVVAASRLEAFRAELPVGVHALRVLLVADAADPRDGLATVREARNGLFDDDRVEVVGIQLALPAGADPGRAAAGLLAALDFSAPAWVEVPLTAGWEHALEVLAEDGSESVAVRAAVTAAELAAFVRRAVDLDLAVRVSDGGRGGDGHDVAGAVRGPHPGSGATTHGLLNLLCAVRAALNGAETAQVEAVVTCTEHPPLAAAVRRMSAADAAVSRAFLTGVDTADVAGVVQDLLALGLL
jgi:hypothetical protein